MKVTVRAKKPTLELIASNDSALQEMAAANKCPEFFKKLNNWVASPSKVFGFWRQYPSSDDNLPFPVALPVKGYDQIAFMEALEEKQKEAEYINYRGFSRHRWSGEPNGSREYSLDGWKWPDGVSTYLRQGVPPSRAFYEFITGNTLDDLPW